jgi:CheY-like chemotaxis protein
MNIIIIDDSPTNLLILRSFVARIKGAQSIGFSDPLLAVRHLRSNPADLIVVDYSMPGITGIEITKQLRASLLHAQTPIVMVTSSLEQAVRLRAVEVGVTGFLRKPVDAREFGNCLQDQLGMSRRQASFQLP